MQASAKCDTSKKKPFSKSFFLVQRNIFHRLTLRLFCGMQRYCFRSTFNSDNRLQISRGNCPPANFPDGDARTTQGRSEMRKGSVVSFFPFALPFVPQSSRHGGTARALPATSGSRPPTCGTPLGRGMTRCVSPALGTRALECVKQRPPWYQDGLRCLRGHRHTIVLSPCLKKHKQKHCEKMCFAKILSKEMSLLIRTLKIFFLRSLTRFIMLFR